MRRPILSLGTLIGIATTSWWLCTPGSPPSLTINPLSVQADSRVKGDVSDTMPPVSHWRDTVGTVGTGTVLVGETSDLGDGVSNVAVQLQRTTDNEVWDGTQWQESVGETTDATLWHHVYIHYPRSSLIHPISSEPSN